MTFLSTRIQQMNPSMTLALNQKANELIAQGKDILNLGAGEPDFPTPLWICEAAYEAAKKGQTRYTAAAGTKELRQAVLEKFQKENELTYTLDEVMISTGGKQVIFNAFMATLNPGDEVIIPAPYWVTYIDVVRFAEGIPVILTCPAETGYKLTPEALERAITPRTKWVVLNSPSNPSGAVYTKEELQALGEVLLRHPHVLIFSDDIYEHILFEGTFYTLAQVEPRLKDRTLVMNGVSKSYAMTGWRIGYGAGPKTLIQAMIKLQSQSISCACSIAQAAALAALKGPQDLLTENNERFLKRRNLLINGLKDIPGLSFNTPAGAFYLFISWKGLKNKFTPQGVLLKTDQDFASYLLEDVGLAVIPGDSFGLEEHFRLSFATDEKTLQEACDRLQEAVKRLK